MAGVRGPRQLGMERWGCLRRSGGAHRSRRCSAGVPRPGRLATGPLRRHGGRLRRRPADRVVPAVHGGRQLRGVGRRRSTGGGRRVGHVGPARVGSAARPHRTRGERRPRPRPGRPGTRRRARRWCAADPRWRRVSRIGGRRGRHLIGDRPCHFGRGLRWHRRFPRARGLPGRCGVSLRPTSVRRTVPAAGVRTRGRWGRPAARGATGPVGRRLGWCRGRPRNGCARIRRLAAGGGNGASHGRGRRFRCRPRGERRHRGRSGLRPEGLTGRRERRFGPVPSPVALRRRVRQPADRCRRLGRPRQRGAGAFGHLRLRHPCHRPIRRPGRR